MQAVMVWEHEHLPPAERTGYIHKPIKEDGSIVGAECDVEHEHHYLIICQTLKARCNPLNSVINK